MTTDERVSTLESHIDTLNGTLADLRGQLRQAKVDTWQGRIDDLGLQVHLGAADASDRVGRATTVLRQTWEQTRAQMLGVSSDADAAARALHDRVEKAYDDVRASLIEAKNTVTHRS